MSQQPCHFIYVAIIATVLFCGCKKESSPVSAANNPPAAPGNPTPANVATGISTLTILYWSSSDPEGDSLMYDVYFGTEKPPTTLISQDQPNASIIRNGLSYITTYYWKIVVKDNHNNSTSGPVWQFTTISDGTVITPQIVPVAGGTFTAGSTPVTISSFNIDNYEVTFELWTEVRNWGLANGYTDLPAGGNGYRPIGLNNPVTGVNWYDVVKWCNARSEKDGFAPVYYIDSAQSIIYRTGQIAINIDAVKWTANGYRLPTECEWEYATRGGNQTHGCIYGGSNTIDDVAWYSSNSNYSTYPVGQKKANELGIYDMSGNVCEWCWDSYWYGDPAYPWGGTTDPKGYPMAGSYRMMRGGSWSHPEVNCRVDDRNPYAFPNDRFPDIGFRCVKD